jgi:hypothetical protein
VSFGILKSNHCATLLENILQGTVVMKNKGKSKVGSFR